MKGITSDELYKLMDRLSINDIGALIAGASPNCIYTDNYNGDYYINIQIGMPDNVNEVFSQMLKILSRAIIAGELKAQVVINTNVQNLTQDDLSKDWLLCGDIDTERTTIARDDIKAWLEARGVYPSVFFPNGRKDDYLNHNHECYSPELALCVRAWEMAQTAHYETTTKQFMADWIKTNAKQYGWINRTEPEKPMGNDKAKELASVANWNTKGGAVKGNPKLKQPTPPKDTPMPIYDELKINLPKKSPVNGGNDIPF